MNHELQEKLDSYRKQQLDKLFRSSRLLTTDSEEEKARIYGALKPPCDRLMLYRYYKLDANGYVLSSLRHGKVVLSNPKIFNDPFDSLLYVDREKIREAQKLYPPERIVEAVNSIRAGNQPSSELDIVIQELFRRFALISEDEVREAFIKDSAKIDRDTALLIDNAIGYCRSKLRIACFSERCDSPLMWAHYADCGRGICVEYDVPTSGELAHAIKGLHLDRRCSLAMFPITLWLADEAATEANAPSPAASPTPARNAPTYGTTAGGRPAPVPRGNTPTGETTVVPPIPKMKAIPCP